jgi:Flp pilus assembly protein TadG
MKNLRRCERGSSSVELALMAPLFALLAVGTIEVGTYMYDGMEVGNGARAGVQYGAQGSTASIPATYLDTAGIMAAAQADAKQVTLTRPVASDVTTYFTCENAPGTRYAVTPTCTGTNNHVDTYVQVVAAASFTPSIAVPGLPSTLTIVRTAVQQLTP